jgi:hypothetical protein
LCGGGLQNMLTFRQEAGQASARMILVGTVTKSDFTRGTSEFRIDSVLRSDAALGDKKVLELPRPVPILDPKDPPKFLVFCDVFKDKLDPYRGVPIKSDEMVKYLKGALELDPKDRGRALLYYFSYLEHPEPKIAEDAFLEFAKSTDQEIGQIASKMSAAKLRGWIKDTRTPPERLSMYAFLLGACGGNEDAALLRTLLEKPSEQTMKAFDGILGGYIQLKPEEGWDLALSLVRDPKKDFQMRFAVVRLLRFYHGWKPTESKDRVLRGLATVLPQGDLADLAVEDLRRWEIWDLTDDVLALYGKKTHDAPIMRRAILRYAMSCPKPATKTFVDARRRDDPTAVRDVEEALQAEKK